MDDSNFVLNNEQLASVTGAIEYNVPAGAMTGSISATGTDVVNLETQFQSASSLLWDVSTGGDAGMVSVASEVSLLSSALWEVEGSFEYGDNAYSLSVQDETAKLECYGNGQYGGTWEDW